MAPSSIIPSEETTRETRTKTPKKAAHDTGTPPQLLAFMTRDWAPAPTKMPKAIAHVESFKARRKALSKAFRGQTLIVPTGHEKVRANDTSFRFRAGTDFYYLTGNQDPDCVLVLVPTATGHRDVLFVEPNPGHSDATFFTDRNKGQLWVGPRPGVPECRALYGVADCRPLTELDALLKTLARQAKTKVRVLRGVSPKLDGSLASTDARDREFAGFLSEMRLLKDAQELRELSAVIASTHRGFEDVIASFKGARSEREFEGIFNLRARVEGNDVGYNTIAACGHHAGVLHWTRNDGPVKKGELLLLDAGVEGTSLYTADITRTLPVSGKFTKAQREIYTLVHTAQAAAFKAVKPGNDFMAPNRAAMKVLAEGLESLGILRVPAAEALADEKQFYRRYSLHNVSHMLGLDVHDCAAARAEVYKFGALQTGMVLTVEPGLYFQMDDLTVPERYRGIGVRIEDDVVVTARGMKNLSADIPSTASDVESWIARVWKRRKTSQLPPR